MLATLGACQPGNPTAAQPQCYAHYSEEDSSVLRLAALAPAVRGRFTFLTADHSDGTDGLLRGAMHGDTLLADYWLGEEASGISAPVAFLRWRGGWVEGWGDIDITQPGKHFTFKNPTALRYDTTRVFHSCACPPPPAARLPTR